MVVTFREEYHTLCKAMDRLNYLGRRIYLDALWLAVDKEESGDAWTELGKVEGLLLAVNNLWKKWKSQFREREACNDEPSLTMSKTTSGNRRDVVMTESDDPEEVVVKFLVPQSLGLDEDDNDDDEDEEDDVEITISTCWEGEEEEEEVLLQEVTSQGGIVSNLLVPSLRNDKEKRTSSGLDQPHPDDGGGGGGNVDVDVGGGGGGGDDGGGGGDDDDDAFNSGLTVGEPNERKTTDSDLIVLKKKRRYKQKPIPSKNIRFPQSENYVPRTELIEELGISPSFMNIGRGSTVVCPVCNKVLTGNTFYKHLQYHVRENGNRLQLCNLCGKEVKNLKSHMKSHRMATITTRNFKCTHCPKDFRTASNLSSHIKRMHGPPESWICDICGKVFKFRTSLTKHQRFTHNREQEGVCPFCHKTFKCNLKRHLRIHTSTGAYPCSVCGKVFRTVDRHYYHENRHTSNFPYQCSLCDHIGFRTSRWLDEHMQKRHPNGEKIVRVRKKRGRASMKNGNRSMASDSFKCQTCGREFKFPTNLARHKKSVHGGVKPFSCPVCARAFATKNSLITHLWTHSSSKKYPCVLCDKGFNDRRHLVSHVKRDHPGYNNLPLPNHTTIPPQEFQHLPHLRPDPRYRNMYSKPAKVKMTMTVSLP